MSDWIDYEYGKYRITDGVLACQCVSWKPMVPKGVEVDYTKSNEFYVYSSPPKSIGEASVHYFLVPVCE